MPVRAAELIDKFEALGCRRPREGAGSPTWGPAAAGWAHEIKVLLAVYGVPITRQAVATTLLAMARSRPTRVATHHTGHDIAGPPAPQNYPIPPSGRRPRAVGITDQVRQAGIVTAVEIAPIDATPFAGVVPWLVSLWRKLRAEVEVHQATNEEQQVLHLIEYVTSIIGGPVLAASNVGDLDDRLDSVIGSEALLGSIQHLLAQHLTLFETAEPPTTTRIATAVGDSLGAAQARV